VIAFKALQNIANRLQVIGTMCGSAFRRKSPVVSALSVMPQLKSMGLSRLFPWKASARRKMFLARPFFSKVTFSSCYLKRSWMYQAQLSEAYLFDMQLYEVNISNAVMEGIIITYTLLWNINLSNSNLQKAEFRSSKLVNVDFSGANLQESVFSLDTLLWKVNLSNSNLQKAEFRSSKLVDIDFSGANLQEAVFSGMQLSNVDFAKVSSLQRTAFSGAELNNVNLSNIDLRGVDLQFAKLNAVNLAQADLQGTMLYGATIGDTTTLDHVEWWKADFSYGEDKHIDINQLEDVYQRSGNAIPEKLNIDTDVHPSVRDFLKGKITAEEVNGR
jgi:uncharacterized protein YjbI with pentapeptide repeats